MTQVESIKTVFDNYLGTADDYQLEEIGIVDDEVTDEQFLEVMISVTEETMERDKPHEFVRPAFQAYARLVGDGGLDYPMEAVLCVRDCFGEGTMFGPVLSCRVSTMWVREHVHGNYCLSETIDRVLGTLKHPEGETLEEMSGWVPEYSLDWRQEEPMIDGEEYPERISYDDWAGKKTDYGGDSV